MGQNAILVANLEHQLNPIPGEAQSLAVSTSVVQLTASNFANAQYIRIQMSAGDTIRATFTGGNPAAGTTGELISLGDSPMILQRTAALAMKFIRNASTDGQISASGWEIQ